MYVIVLKLTERKDRAGEFMEAHRDWIRRGFDDGLLLLVGTIRPGLGGLLLAQCPSRSELEERVAADPFVAQGIAVAEILDVGPSRVDERLALLKD